MSSSLFDLFYPRHREIDAADEKIYLNILLFQEIFILQESKSGINFYAIHLSAML